MDSKEFVKLVARACLRAYELREQSWDKERHVYRMYVQTSVNLALDEVGITADSERKLAYMCCAGGFQGEFADWAQEEVKGESS